MSRRRNAALGAVGIAIAISVASIRLAAQSSQRFEAEFGAAVLRQTGVPLRTAPTLGGIWAWEGARTAARVDGVVAAGSGDWAGQLAAGAAYFALDPDAPLELGGEVRTARVAGTAGTTQVVATVRRHLTTGGVLRPTRGIWAGGVGGVTVGDATVGGAGHATAVFGVEAGGWRTISASTRALATVTWTATHADSLALVRAGTVSTFDAFARGASRVRTIDATTTIEHTASRIELTGSAGVRHTAVSAGALAIARVRWDPVAIGAVTWWLRPGVGAVLTAGTHPADPARALPAVQHVAFTLRLRPGAWSLRAPRSSSVRARLPAVDPPAARLPDSLRTTSLRAGAPSVAVTDDGRGLRVRVPGATRVQIRAAATEWRAVDLVRGADGDWTLALAWPSGAHRVALRIDDGPWMPPANTPAVDDEYGGRVGLLVVP